MDKSWFESRPDHPYGLPISKLGDCIDYLRDILGDGWVLNEIQSYRDWCKNYSIPLIWNFRNLETNPLIPMFTVFEDWRSDIKKPKPPAIVIDLATIAGAVSYFEPYWSSLVKDVGKNHIRFSMRNPQTCRGIIYELTTAFHYVRAGATPVTPLFMGPAKTDKADILITWQDVEIEVHCKTKIPGAGQKIPELFDYLAGCTLGFFKNLTGKSLQVKLVCNDELKREDVYYILERIRNLIRSGLVGNYPICDNRYLLRIREIMIPPGGITVSEVEKLYKPMYRAILADNALSMLPGHGYYRLSVFDGISRRRPRVASSLKDSIKQAIKQVTGKRPSIVTIHFYDKMDWEVANKLEGFKRFLEQQLTTRKGKDVGVLVLTGEPLTTERWTGHVYERSLPAIWFINSHVNPSVRLPTDFKVS